MSKKKTLKTANAGVRTAVCPGVCAAMFKSKNKFVVAQLQTEWGNTQKNEEKGSAVSFYNMVR